MEINYKNTFLMSIGLCLIFIAFSKMSVNGNPLIADGNTVNNGDLNNDQILSPEDGLQKKNRRHDCPLCDSSVYSYCTDKLLHDACCCLNPYETRLPPQCKYADCSFLHANSCQEHRLITACCCNHYAYAGTT